MNVARQAWGFLGLIVLLFLGYFTYIKHLEDLKVAYAADSIQERLNGLVETLQGYGVTDKRVLEAMGKIRRHEFIPLAFQDIFTAYGDHPCPIGHGQTISQPYIVAYMTEKIHPVAGDKILEIGTGSGYQAAVLASLGAEVFSIEIVPELARHAEGVLKKQGFSVHVRAGDGYRGWPEQAPFDAVIVTCAPQEIPPALVDQVKEGGRMILPVGDAGSQRLVIVRKTGGKAVVEEDLPVRFVPMVHGTDPAVSGS
jgi:protein-L-isoaspartate(D-aspartate) O-methyltransferase